MNKTYVEPSAQKITGGQQEQGHVSVVPKSSFAIGIIVFDEHELIFKLLGLRLEREMVIGMGMQI